MLAARALAAATGLASDASAAMRCMWRSWRPWPRRGVCPVDATTQTNARIGVRRSQRCRVITERDFPSPGSSRGWRATAPLPETTPDHLHVRIDRHSEGRGGHASRGRRVRRREAQIFLRDNPIGQETGAGRAVVAFDASCEEIGWRGGTAPAGSCTAVAGAQRMDLGPGWSPET